jgi:hypothetical protein
MTTDAAFERALRTVLSEGRPVGGAPASLRGSVLGIPDSVREAPAIVRFVRAIGVPLAAVGAAATAVVLAAFGMTRVPIQGLPPGSVGGAISGFDPSIEGPGLVTNVLPTAVIAGLMLIVVAAAVTAGTFFSSRASTGRGRTIILLGIVGVAAGIGLIRFDPGLSAGNYRGAPLGYVEAPAGPLHDELVWIQTAGPDDPTVGVFSLRNTAAVPVRIEGILAAYSDGVVFGHWTAMWMPPGGPGWDAPGLDQIRPFEPVTLEPGAGLIVYAAGRAGPCAFGPSFDPSRQYSETEIAGYTELGPLVQVAYSVYGLASVAVIDIEETFAEPARAGCFDAAQASGPVAAR